MTKSPQRDLSRAQHGMARLPKALSSTGLLACLVATITGCAQIETAQSKTKEIQTVATTLRDQAVANSTSAAISRTSRPRLAGEEIVLRNQYTLPEAFNKRMSYSTQGAQSLSDVLTVVGDTLGIPVRSAELAQSESTTRPGQPNPQFVPGMSQMPGSGGIQGKVQLEYSGTVRGLLDELATRSDASWRYVAKGNTIEFFKYETRTLSIYLPPGSKSIEAAISLTGVGNNGGASTSGGGTASVSQSLTVNPWSSIMGGIQSILGDAPSASGASAMGGAGGARPGGGGGGAGGGTSTTTASGPSGRASANPELGIITVTARPATLQRVVSYVNSINARFSQNVMIDIKVYNLTLDSQASAGFSLDVLYRKLGDYGVSVVGASPLQPATGTPGQLTIGAGSNSRFAGSSIVAQALSQFGNVALQTQGQVLAINGQPSPIQVANEINYLASSATTSTTNAGNTSTLTPGTKVVGFTANFLPLILGDNRILLQYQIQLSSLNSLTQISSGTSSIQTPQISSQTLQQQAFVRDGQSVVLFGFDQARDTLDSAVSLGGLSKAARSERQMVVIVMQVNGGTKDAM